MNSDQFTLQDFLDLDAPDLFEKARRFHDFLNDWKARGTYSYHRVLTAPCLATTRILDPAASADREHIVLSSNNYLGLNAHPKVLAAARRALETYGTGMCGSRFLSGTHDLVTRLEHELAAFKGTPAAMVFTSGYQANVGVISALLRPPDIAYIDRLSHASIVDGCRLAGCTFKTFHHNDIAHFKRQLERTRARHRGAMLIVDGVFSMDGDLAPLPELITLAKAYDVRVLVDDAHATGVIGKTGRGTAEHFGVDDAIDITLGTFSKTFGATGGFITADEAVIEYVRHYGRSYMFSASPTPAVVATVLAGLQVIQAEPELRQTLWRNVRYVHAELKAAGFTVYPDPPESAIMTIEVGEDVAVREISRLIYQDGIFASTVAYPAVPRNHGKIRLSVSALHTSEQLSQTVAVLARAAARVGLNQTALPTADVAAMPALAGANA